MSLLTTVAKYGTKLVGGALKGLRFGQKAAGEVHKYGEKAKHAAWRGDGQRVLGWAS